MRYATTHVHHDGTKLATHHHAAGTVQHEHYPTADNLTDARRWFEQQCAIGGRADAANRLR